jgi:hypothetical protein
MTKIRVWVEIMTTQKFAEEIMDAPENWSDMTSDQREDWMADQFEQMRNEMANGGYEVIE